MWCTFRHSGARGSLGKLPEGGLFQLRHSGQVASSGGIRRDFSWLGGIRGHVSDSEHAPKGSSGLVGSKGFPEGESFSEVFIVGLGINGWDFSVRSDRGE